MGELMDKSGLKINIIRSRRKTMSLEISGENEVLVRAPLRISKREIVAFVDKSSPWIEKHMEMYLEKKSRKESIKGLSEDELQNLKDRALQVFPEKVKYYASLIGVDYGRITIRSQKTKWGSCTERGNLNFNIALLLAPEEVLDYVVIHELCHRKEMNHSKRFWDEVSKVMPDYKVHRKWLKDNGDMIMERIRLSMN